MRKSAAASKNILSWRLEAAVVLSVAAVALAIPGWQAAGAGLLVFLLPGLAVMRWLGLVADRSAAKVFVAAGLSVALAPAIIYWAARFVGFERLPIALALGGACLLVALFGRLRAASWRAAAGVLFSGRRRWLFAGLVGGMAILVALPYLQVTLASDVVLAPPITDWPKHYAVVWLIERTGVPPLNLLYPPQAGQPLVYYYFFHLLVASLRLLAGTAFNALAAFVAVSVVTVLAFWGLFAILARRVVVGEWAALLSLLFVTVIGGLDILAVAGQVALRTVRDGQSLSQLVAAENLGGWSSCLSNVHDFYSHAVWAPHHLAGAMIFLLLLVLWAALGRRLRLAVLVPVLLFSLLGFSVYVFIPVAVAIGLFVLHDVLSQSTPGGRTRPALAWIALGLAWFAVSFPMLRTLWEARTIPSVGLALRVAFNGINWRQAALVSAVIGRQPLARLLDGALFFVFELGAALFLGVAGWWATFRRCRTLQATGNAPTRCQLANWLAIAGAVALLLSLLFVSKGSTQGVTCNDFRMRGLLPFQIALACFAGLGLRIVLRTWRRPLHFAIIVLAMLGLLTTAWYVRGWGAARFFTRQGVPAEAADAYRFLREQTPAAAVVQGSVGPDVLRDQSLLVFGERPSRVALDLFPLLQVDATRLRSEAAALAGAFATRDSEEAWRVFASAGVAYVFVGPEERQAYGAGDDLAQLRDPVYFELVYETPSYAIFHVRPAPRAS